MPTPESVGGWLWRPLLGASLIQTVLFMVRPAMSYSILQFGGDATTIGWVTSLYAIAPMLLAIWIGRTAGRLSRIAVVPAVAVGVVAVACVVLALSVTIWMLAVASVLLGVGIVAVIVGGQTWIARSAPPHRFDDAFGWMTAGMSLGQALGPVTMGLLVGGADDIPDPSRLSATYWAAALLSVAALVCFLSRARRLYRASGPTSVESPRTLQILRIPRLVKYIFASAAVLTTIDILGAFLPAVGSAYGIPPTLVGALLAARALASMASRLFLGVMARRWDRVLLTSASTLISAASMVVVAFWPEIISLFVAMIVGGVFLGVVQPLTISTVATLVPERARSEALALRLVGNRVAQAAAPLAAALVAGAAGVAAVFALQAAFLALSTVWVGFRRPSP